MSLRDVHPVITCGYVSAGRHRRAITIDTREADLDQATLVLLREDYRAIGHPLYARLPQASFYRGGEQASFPAIEALITAGAATEA